MKKLLFIFLSILLISCDNEKPESPESIINVDVVDELVVIDMGDPCDCIDKTIFAVDEFSLKMDAGEYESAETLNIAFEEIMKDCIMHPYAGKGYEGQEASLVWSAELETCEMYELLKSAALEFQMKLIDFNDVPHDDFMEKVNSETSGGAAGVLEMLKEGAK